MVIAIFFIAATGILIYKNSNTVEPLPTKEIPKASKTLPKLLDLGAHKCVPCKMMMPILDTLRTDYKEKLEVVFIDVWEDRDAGNKYGIRSIPTQIFYDEKGVERFRHEGYWSKEDILKKFNELEIKL